MAPEGESGRFGDIRRVDETGSTNADVVALARAGAPEGIVVVADFQRDGRGRRGRTWTAPPGSSLLASVLWRPPLAPSVVPLVGLAAAAAAVEACAGVAGVAPSLKWPNDVVESAAGTAKLAGVLAESLTDGDGLAVVVGMGCNLTTAPAGATCLEDLAGRPVDRDELLDAWLARLDRWCSILESAEGPRAVVQAYRGRCITLGRRVRVEMADRPLEGRAVDVTQQGHLVVETAVGRREVAAGEVIHLRPPP